MFGLVFLFLIVVINLFEIFLIFIASLSISTLDTKVKSKIFRVIAWGFLICTVGELSYFGFVSSSPFINKPTFLDYCQDSLFFYGIFILNIRRIVNYMKDSEANKKNI